MNVLESFSLAGKTAVVTGGAGMYGRQIVEALAEAGAEVVVASRDLAKLETLASRIGNVVPKHLDLADESSIRGLIAELPRLDILVNNAVTRSANVNWDRPMSDFDSSLHVNASAVFLLTRLAAERMKERGGGSIINIGSYMGLLGPNFTNYTGTHMMDFPSPAYFYEKGGLVNFTRFAASVLGKDHIRVNCINPGGFQIPSHPKEFIENYSKNTMLGRLANSTDLKGAVVFLASGASDYVTGANLNVDGGYTAK